MSLIVAHLRWDGVDQEQYDSLCRALPQSEQRPGGCLLSRRRRQGQTVMATLVWADDRSAGEFLTGRIGEPAGLPEPHRAVFALPDCFAAGYGIPPSRRAPTGPAPSVPAPRVPDESRPTATAHTGRT